jgi:hypothetical protein
MTEEPKTRLFSITIHAWRLNQDGNSEVNIQNVIALIAGDFDIAQLANEQAHKVYPDDEDWKGHNAIWTEIPPDSQLGPFRLRWVADVVGEDATAGAEA